MNDNPMELQISQILSELVADGSIELIEASAAAISQGRELLPYAMSVFVPAMAKRSLMTSLKQMQSLSRAGFEPVPHIAARRMSSEKQLHDFLIHAVGECRVRRILLIAGDLAEPEGPFTDTLDVLDSGILQSCGIKEVSFAGYPEGHSQISHQALQEALARKLAWAADAGIASSVLTQFSFAPVRIIQFCATLELEAPGVPVYVGIAGPTEITLLMEYARLCGVSTSLRALRNLGVKAAKMAMHTDPTEQLHMLAHHCAAHETNNIIGIHLFSFGGFSNSARWMHDMIGCHAEGEVSKQAEK
jgi:methylenetetrahydrofolate reductase (NADPH)